MVETGKIENAMQNLLFLVKAGLIQDPEGKIAALASNPKTAPVLPARPDTTELGTKVDKVDVTAQLGEVA
jgi:hypothetical protein